MMIFYISLTVWIALKNLFNFSPIYCLKKKVFLMVHCISPFNLSLLVGYRLIIDSVLKILKPHCFKSVFRAANNCLTLLFLICCIFTLYLYICNISIFHRTVIQPGTYHPDIQLLHPINLEFLVNRNLAASWYHKVPVVEIKGHLDSMNVSIRVTKKTSLLKF